MAKRLVAGRAYDLVIMVGNPSFPLPEDFDLIGKGIYAGKTRKERENRNFFYFRAENNEIIEYRFNDFVLKEDQIVVDSGGLIKKIISDKTGFFEEWFERKGL